MRRPFLLGCAVATLAALGAPVVASGQVAVDDGTPGTKSVGGMETTLDGESVAPEVAVGHGNACTTTADNTLACRSDVDIDTLSREGRETLRVGNLPPGHLVMPPPETLARILGEPSARSSTSRGKGPTARASLASCGGRLDSHIWTGGHFNDSWWHGGYLGNGYWRFSTAAVSFDNAVTSYKDSQYFNTGYWDGDSKDGAFYGGGWELCEEAQDLSTGNPAWNNRFSSMQLAATS